MAGKRQVIDSAAVLGGEVLKRFPRRAGRRFPADAVCQVGENHQAVLYRDGRAQGAIGPGRHRLSGAAFATRAIPEATEGSHGSHSETLCFVDQRVFSRIGWEAPRPVVVRDRELGEVSLRVSGFYTFRIVDPLLCLGAISPEEAPESSADLSRRLCERIQGRLEALLPRRLESLRELPHHFNELATELRLELQLDMDRMGIQLIDFFLTTLHPEEPRLGIAGGNLLLLPQAIRRDSRRVGGGSGSREPADAGIPAPEAQPECGRCERAVPEGAHFCPWCGLSLSGDA